MGGEEHKGTHFTLRGFHSKERFPRHRRPTLKGKRIFMVDDLTPNQLTHVNECMPKIKEERAKGKLAFYWNGCRSL